MARKYALGQSEEQPELEPMTVGEVWSAMMADCQQYMSLPDCQSLLGYQPLFFPPEKRPRFGKFLWLGFGLVLGYVVNEELNKKAGKGYATTQYSPTDYTI